LTNAAREPEITDLARCLIAMGADIEGLGSERLVVRGQSSLHGADYAVMSDRIEAGTYAVAAAITGGEIELVGAEPANLGAVIETLQQSGANIEHSDDGLKVSRRRNAIAPVDIESKPYPGFPTDMQAQMMALLCMSNGTSRITENIFENRFMHVPELSRMGADITLRGSTADVRGIPRLRGAPVMATDLRASVCLVLAGLAAEGETTVGRVYHLDRGYERLVDKLATCGADIERAAA
jgi:UDP-N-acetylglucosamine 1-carboxyvinyltransferase